VQMGDLYGEMQIAADSSADGRVTNVVVDVPTAHVRMPDKSPHNVQPLDEPKKVRVGTFRAPGQFVTLPIDGEDLDEPEDGKPSTTRTNVTIRLGKDVMIERGQDVRVALEGNPQILISDTVRMSGQIRLRSGSLEVQGKRFEIEKGTVTFIGDDPGNPNVVVTAAWTAPDGTRVMADFTGPLKTGKVTLRSEPGRPQDEILALILFGTADGSAATPYAQPSPDGATRAGTAAGGLAAGGLSQGLDKLTGLDVEAKVDTSDSANPRPEVELRVARDISLEIAFVLGTPPPGTNQDRTFATVDWRFMRNWSLATTFGDQGSSIADVIWRYRY
jgi:translocation and assembly module TamB